MSNNNLRFERIRGNQNSLPVNFEIEIAGIKKDDFILEENSQIKVYNHSNILKIKRKNLEDLQIKNNLGKGGLQLYNCFNINYVNQYGMCNLLNLEYILTQTNIPQSGGKYYEKSFNRPIGKIKNKDNKTDKRRYLGKKIRNNRQDADKMLNKGYLYCDIIDYKVGPKEKNVFHAFLEITAKGKNASEYEIGKLKLVEDGDFKEQFNQLIFERSQKIYNLKDSDFNKYVKILTRYTIILYITKYLKDAGQYGIDLYYDNITDIIENQILITRDLYDRLKRRYEVAIEEHEMYKIAYDLIYFSNKTTKLQSNLQSPVEMVNEVYKMIPENSNVNPVEYFKNIVPLLKEIIKTQNNWTSVSAIMKKYKDAKISINSLRKTGLQYNRSDANVYRESSSMTRMIPTKTNNN